MTTEKNKKLPFIVVRDIVVFPNTIVSIFVGKQKSIEILKEVIKNDSDIFVVSQKDNEYYDEIDVINLPKIGTICKISQSMTLPDGTIRVVLNCVYRASVIQCNDNVCEVEILKDVADEECIVLSKEVRDIIDCDGIVKSRLNKDNLYNSIIKINDPGVLCDILSSKVSWLSLDTKFDLLQTFNLRDRIKKIIEILNDENKSHAIRKEIQYKIRKEEEKRNREYYLLEQMRIIKKELGHYKKSPLEAREKYEKKILEKHLPKIVADKVMEEIEKLEYFNINSPEYAVIRTYIETILSLPWVEKSDMKTDIKLAEECFNKSHYGMEKVKERILENIAIQIKTGNQPKKTILCLYGPPGVGKTSLTETIAKVTGRSFVKIALGGVRDEAEIRGHRRTYIGSMPGKIIDAMKKAKTINPIILLDEIDKMSCNYKGDPENALLEVLDYQQNNKFVDHYLDLEYDLSQVMFIATANSLKMSHALLDRLEVIRIPSYLEQEKFYIAKNFIVPRQLRENGFLENECCINDDVITDIIKYYTREAGVRDLERKIGKLCRKAVMENLKTNKPVEITKKKLKDYLGIKKYEHTVIERKDFIGVVNGLAYTEFGGDILMIEAVKIPNGKGDIKFTGDLGNVMKESIQTAFSLVKSKAKSFGISSEIFKKYDIHVHVPDGATPKDGPSAGITIVSAIVSLLTKRPVSKYLAMTGEISLRGAVLPIGGLREKLTSAIRSGVKEVIIPKDNKKDLEEIPNDILKKLKIYFCDRIEKVISIVFNDFVYKNPTEKNEDNNIETFEEDKKKNIDYFKNTQRTTVI